MADGDRGIEKQFNRAAEYVKRNTSSFDTASLLSLYARFKQAKEGPCNTPKPGFFDFQGKQKWDAWQKLGNMERLKAMSEYVKIVTNIKPEWQDKASGEDTDTGSKLRKDGLGVAVSVMVNEDTFIDDDRKTVFDWCKEGNVKKVMSMLDKHSSAITTADDDGLMLLHWACDRGFNDMVKMLLSKGAQINKQDADGQTPLHYAVACEHLTVVKTLISHHADTQLTDEDGITPAETDTSAEIRDLLLLACSADDTQTKSCSGADGVS